MVKAIFLDRDGVINREVHHLHKKEQLRLLPRSAEAIARLKKMGYHIVVVTNQSVVGRGMATEKEIADIHALLCRRLQKKNAAPDAVYYCPHHPEAAVAAYRTQCDCRKPNTGMIMRAVKEMNIDLGKSFLIGDRTGDILSGIRAGVRTILVKTGYAGSDREHVVTPHFVADNLNASATLIARLARRAI